MRCPGFINVDAFRATRFGAKEWGLMLKRGGGVAPTQVAEATSTKQQSAAHTRWRTMGVVSERGLTTEEVARLYRVSPDKVRAWIKRGELAAVNTSSRRCARPRYIITPAALAAFEREHAAQTDAPKPARRPRKDLIDFFPDFPD